MPVDPNELRNAVQSESLVELGPSVFNRSVDYRAVRLQGLDVLDGTTAGVGGGRYNEPGSNPTTYLAGSQTLASLECESDLLDLGFDPQPKNPRLVCSVVVEGARILDLTDNSVLERLAVDRKELLGPSKVWRNLNAAGSSALSPVIGAVARSQNRIDGILAPSWFKSILGDELPRMENLVLFMSPQAAAQHRNSNVRIRLHDSDRLLG